MSTAETTTARRALWWWPPIGVLAMLLLGWAVGRHSTGFDDGAARQIHSVFGTQPRWLLVFTDWLLLGPIWLICLGIALWRRRWRLAAVVAAAPWVIIEINEAFKRMFDRRNGPYLEYPSGHTTLVVAIMGMLLLVVGLRWWAVTVAVVVSVLGMLGLVACGYHFLTDTVGAALLTTALVCVAALVAGLPAIAGPPRPHRPETPGPADPTESGSSPRSAH